MKFRFLLLTLCLMTASLPSFGQKPEDQSDRKARKLQRKAETDHYLVLGSGLATLTLQDTRMTPHVYAAPGAGISFSQIDTRRGVIKYSDYLNLQYGYMVPLGAGSSGHAIRVSGGYSQVWEKQTSSRWSSHYGGGVYGQLTSKILPALSNSFYHHEAAVTLRARAEFEREFRLRRRNLIVQYRIQVPVMAYVNRVPEFGLDLGLSKSYAAPIGRWNQVISEVGLEGWLSNRNDNRWRLSYQWDYYYFKEGVDHLHAASHSLMFAFLIHT